VGLLLILTLIFPDISNFTGANAVAPNLSEIEKSKSWDFKHTDNILRYCYYENQTCEYNKSNEFSTTILTRAVFNSGFL
jgi:hypothetical protein